MADTTGVQVFVGPANQLTLGPVTEGPAAATLTTTGPNSQRLDLTIPAPTTEVVDAANAAAASADAAATAAAGSKTAAETAQGNAATSAAAAQAAQAAAEAAVPTQDQVDAAVASLMPTRIGIDEDGVPYFY